MAEQVVRRLGLGSIRRGEPWEDLRGAVGDFYLERNIIGVAPVDPRSSRWRFAAVKDGIGLWDFDGPAEPVERFAAFTTDEAERRYMELVVMPTLERQVLDGERAWAKVEVTAKATGDRICMLWLLHRSVAGFVACVNAEWPYGTRWSTAFRTDRFYLRRREVERHGVELWPDFSPDPEWPAERLIMPNRSIDDAKRAGTWMWPPEWNIRWTDIPADVPRSFLETCEFVRQLAKAD